MSEVKILKLVKSYSEYQEAICESINEIIAEHKTRCNRKCDCNDIFVLREFKERGRLNVDEYKIYMMEDRDYEIIRLRIHYEGPISKKFIRFGSFENTRRKYSYYRINFFK